jgi:hypothetical protein
MERKAQEEEQRLLVPVIEDLSSEEDEDGDPGPRWEASSAARSLQKVEK